MNIKSISQNNSIPIEESILEVRNLSFRYSKKHPLVLNNIYIDFSKNKLTIIAGPNGSGKTTLMKHFNGSLISNQGEVSVYGEKISKKNRRLIQQFVGLVFQNPDEQIFFPKVYDDVAFGPKNMKLPEEDVKNRVDKALKEVQIYDLKDRITFNLSFGEKKRLAFAGILAMQPNIIVLDEPTIGIDPWSKPRMINIIDSLKKNRTVIVITHDVDVMQIADRILLLKNGQIEGDFSSFDDFFQQEFQK
ncbi:MAG: energy-coupling factor ABC transporter ATP-binding protein [Candidatus Hodarchaeota archaeon]